MSFLKSIQQIFSSSAAPSGAITKKRQRELNKQLLEAAKEDRNNEKIREILDWGADVQARDWLGNTALMLVLKNKTNIEYPELAAGAVEYLAAAGADLTEAQEIAAGQSNPAMKKLLDKITTPEWRIERLLNEAFYGKKGRVEELLRLGTDVNGVGKGGDTALTRLINGEGVNRTSLFSHSDSDTSDFPGTVQVLLAAGADITKANGVYSVQTYAHGEVKKLLEEEIKKRQSLQAAPVVAAAEPEEEISAGLTHAIPVPKRFVSIKPVRSIT